MEDYEEFCLLGRNALYPVESQIQAKFWLLRDSHQFLAWLIRRS
jgi:hypothetical protein